MRHKNIFIGMLVTMLMVCAPCAHASVIWSWDFVNSDQVVGVDDLVSFYISFTNSSASTENLMIHIGTNVVGTGGNIHPASSIDQYYEEPDYYNYLFAYGNVWDELNGVVLEPGESITGTGPLMTYEPIPGEVSQGMYFEGRGSIYMGSLNNEGLDRTFGFRVGDGGSVVPEPSSLLLISLGGLLLARRKRAR